MKYLILIVLLLAVAFAQQDSGAGNVIPGREVPGAAIEQTNSEDVLEQLQGGNNDVFIVLFYVDEAAKGDVAGQIQSEIIGKDHGWVRYTEVDLTKVSDYWKLFKVLGLEGEPKRGHTEPQVLVMSKGEGFVIRGPKIVDGILKRIERVENGSLFGQGTSGKVGGAGYSFNPGK